MQVLNFVKVDNMELIVRYSEWKVELLVLGFSI